MNRDLIGNFRDIGGVKSADGRFVKKGIFFRTSNLEDLTQEDISKIKELGINYIFDYRTDEEASAKPVTVIPEIEYVRVPAFSMP